MPRPTAVDKTGHREEIEHLLITVRWGVNTVSRYMEMRHSVSVTAAQLRNFRRLRVDKLRKDGKLPIGWDPPKADDGSPDAVVGRLMHPDDDLPDVLQRRLALAKLQEERIRLDARHEMAMGKQFNSQGKEIDLLNRIYSDIKDDMKDLGMWPTRESASQVTINNSPMAAAVAGAQVQAVGGGSVEMPGVPEEAMKSLGRNLVLLRHKVESDEQEPDSD